MIWWTKLVWLEDESILIFYKLIRVGKKVFLCGESSERRKHKHYLLYNMIYYIFENYVYDPFLFIFRLERRN